MLDASSATTAYDELRSAIMANANVKEREEGGTEDWQWMEEEWE